MKKYFEKFDHTCDLNVEEDLKDSQNWVSRFKKAVIKWTTIDPYSNLTSFYFNNHSSITNEMNFHQQKYPRTIHPFSRIKTVWECVMSLVIFMGLIGSPLYYHLFVNNNRDREAFLGNCIMLKIVKAFSLLDILVRFHVGYYDRRNYVVSTTGQEFLNTLNKMTSFK